MIWMYVKVILTTLVIFLVIDFLYLGIIAKNLYQQELGHLMKQDVNFLAAFIFYFIFVVGLSIFVIIPSIKSESLLKALILGALFGLVTYATYDLTNYATLEGFPLKIVLIDLAWGSTVSTMTSLFTYIIYQGVFK